MLCLTWENRKKFQRNFNNYYELLGVGKNASKEDIHKAFINLSKIYHPDLGGDEHLFKLLNEAYSCLTNDISRMVYDSFLKSDSIEHAQSLIFEMFVEAMNKSNFYCIDFVQSSIEYLSIEVNKTENQIERMKERLSNSEKAISRLNPKNGYDISFMHSRMFSYQQEIKNQISDKEKYKSLVELTIKLLGTLEFEVDVPENTVYSFSTSTVGGWVQYS